MSLPGRPSHLLRPWPRPCQKSPLPRTRPFHNTSTRNAARSPAARRAQAAKSRPGMATDYLSNAPAKGDLAGRLNSLEEQGIAAWEQAVRSGAMSATAVSKETFLQIAKQLMESAYRQAPSAAAVKSISTDTDLVYKISHFISLTNPSLREWALSSCALAGARVPSLITAARYLSNTTNSPKTAVPQTKVLSQVETFALRDQDPRAMLLHARVLARRGDVPAARALLQQVLETVTPTRRRPQPDEEFLLPGIPTPWHAYLTLPGAGSSSASKTVGGKNTGTEAGAKEEMEIEEKEVREHILHKAAKDFHDPVALTHYALARLQAGDRDAYEENMTMAAMAGNADACRRLANFYYLISQRRIPRRGAKTVPISSPSSSSFSDSDPNTSTEQKQQHHPLVNETEAETQGLLARLFPRFYAPKPHAEYLALALDWYHVAAAHASTTISAPTAASTSTATIVRSKAALMVALILREEGLVSGRADPVDQADEWLQQVGEMTELASFVRQLKLKWEDGRYVPVAPGALVDV